MIFWILVACAIATSGYHAVSIYAALRQRARRLPIPTYPGPVSILKPVRGRDPLFYEAIRSHARQVYEPGFELIFGVRDPQDPALEDIIRLQREFPQLRIEWFLVKRRAPNGKVGVLTEIARHARHELWIVNDSDIAVDPGYIQQVTASLADPTTGVVTCLYRPTADGWPSRWEAFGIAIDFAAGVLVAPLVGVTEFGLGATLAFRRADLAAIGGFSAIEPYLADDYQLARHITQLGKRVELSPVVVETHLGDDSWRGVIRHQIRWARTIRISRGDGYWGLPTTYTGVWALLALVLGFPVLTIILLPIRWASAYATGVGVLRSPLVRVGWILAPLWDLFAFLIWIAGSMFNTVEWRGQRLRLKPDGTMVPE